MIGTKIRNITLAMPVSFLALPAQAQTLTGGLTTFMTNVASLFNTTLGAQIVMVLLIVGAIHDGWHARFHWLPYIGVASTFILGSAWYMTTFYGITPAG